MEHVVETLAKGIHTNISIKQASELGAMTFDGVTDPITTLSLLVKLKRSYMSFDENKVKTTLQVSHWKMMLEIGELMKEHCEITLGHSIRIVLIQNSILQLIERQKDWSLSS